MNPILLMVINAVGAGAGFDLALRNEGGWRVAGFVLGGLNLCFLAINMVIFLIGG